MYRKAMAGLVVLGAVVAGNARGNSLFPMNLVDPQVTAANSQVIDYAGPNGADSGLLTVTNPNDGLMEIMNNGGQYDTAASGMAVHFSMTLSVYVFSDGTLDTSKPSTLNIVDLGDDFNPLDPAVTLFDSSQATQFGFNSGADATTPELEILFKSSANSALVNQGDPIGVKIFNDDTNGQQVTPFDFTSLFHLENGKLDAGAVEAVPLPSSVAGGGALILALAGMKLARSRSHQPAEVV